MSSRTKRPSVPPERIEEAGLNALQTTRQVFYDGWLLRVSPGSAKRARSVSAHFGSTLPVAEKIAHCEDVYARCGLPMLFRLTPFSKPAGLADALRERGYVEFGTTLVQAVQVAQAPSEGPTARHATTRAVEVIDFVNAVVELRGSTEVQRDALIERLQASPLESHYVLVEERGRVVCTAQMAADGGVAGVFDVVTAPHARSRGHASRAVSRLLAWAWNHALGTVYLQVTADNAPAIAVYRKFGFETLYTYRYFGPPGECR
jgi:ribosomal protein S18 acetylase RimI-like enzyme